MRVDPIDMQVDVPAPIDKNLSKGPCRGMIVAKGISRDLMLARVRSREAER